MKLFHLETEIRSKFQYRNDLDEDRPLHPRLGRFSYFWLSTLLLEMLLHFEAMYTLDIDSSFHLVLFLHQVWRRIVLFRQSSHDKCSIFRSYSCTRFPCGSASVWGSAIGSSVGISTVSKYSCASSFLEAPESFDSSSHKSATALLWVHLQLQKTGYENCVLTAWTSTRAVRTSMTQTSSTTSTRTPTRASCTTCEHALRARSFVTPLDVCVTCTSWLKVFLSLIPSA